MLSMLYFIAVGGFDMPMDRSKYPKDWEKIAYEVKDKAGWKCQGSPKYPDCRAEHRGLHPVTGALVILTAAHLDHNPKNNDPSNLKAQCQRCHLAYDQQLHLANAWRTRQRKKGQMLLFSDAEIRKNLYMMS